MHDKFGRGAFRRPWARLNFYTAVRPGRPPVRPNAHVYERTTSNNPVNAHGVGLVNFFVKVRVSIRTCVPNLGAVRVEKSVFSSLYNIQ